MIGCSTRLPPILCADEMDAARVLVGAAMSTRVKEDSSQAGLGQE